MNPRQRVLASLSHIEPDRVAVDFGAHRSSGIAALAYARLRAFLGLPKRVPRVYDMMQQLAVIDPDVLDLLGVDAVELGRGFCRADADWKPWTLPDGSECAIPKWVNMERRGQDWLLLSNDGVPMAVMRPGCLYFEQIHWPLKADPDELARLPELMARVPWALATPPGPVAMDGPGLKFLADGARALRAETDRAIVGLFGGNLMEWGQFLMRIDNFLAALALEPDFVHALLDRLVELHLAALEKYLSAVGPWIDIILFGDDLGTQNGPQISPAMYREFFKPRHAKLWRRAKQLAPVKVMLHCCGGVYPLLEDLIDAGLDAINPVQTSCAGMAPERLKAEFGSRLTLWGGGCDTRHVLPNGTPAEVRRHVREQLRVLAPGGGFVFQQIHNILADIRPENIKAMFDAVRSFSP